jgi:hypothetical protein
MPDLVADAESWEVLSSVEARSMGWVVSFRHTGHFKPGDGPQPLKFYVFRDGWVEVVTKHGSKFHESRRRRFLEQMPDPQNRE